MNWARHSTTSVDQVRRVGAAYPDVELDDYLFDALSAGASGFLLKNAGPEELIAGVRAAAAGDALLAPEVTRRVRSMLPRPVPGRPSRPPRATPSFFY